MKPSLLTGCLSSIIPLFLLLVFNSQQVYSQDNKRIALDLVQNNLKELGLSKSDIDNLYISDAYTDKLSGLMMVYVQQQYKSINIHNALYNIAFKNGKVVSSTNTFVKRLPAVANNDIPLVTPVNAINASAVHLKIQRAGPLNQLRVLEQGKSFEFSNSSISKNNIPVKLVWVSLGESSVRLAWEVHIDPPATNDMWNVRIDAIKGDVLEKDNWTVKCTWVRPFPQFTKSARQNSSSNIRAILPLTMASEFLLPKTPVTKSTVY